ncbi:alpha/beta hydrolase-fold protein [Gemmatimonadota bacterium]
MRLFRYVSMFLLALFIITGTLKASKGNFHDHRHYSEVFGQWRDYRILLPPDYEASTKRYPVIYYFHGHSGRYKGEQYGNGQVFLPEKLEFVGSKDLIIVKWDGYVAEDYWGYYGGAPYDIQNKGWDYDFGAYFLELVDHIDSNYRTIADRQHRATSGLSMGGFMSLYLSGRYSDIVGSVSAFDPAHENHAGPEGMKVLRKHANHVLNHGHSKVRLVKSSGDYLGQHHSLLRDVYARTPEVYFQFRQDEWHRHWVTGISETFSFHMDAFEDEKLAEYPEKWDYDNSYGKFSIWSYDVVVEDKKAGFTCLRNVGDGYLRIYTRQYAPDGPPVEGQTLHLTTAPRYEGGAVYRVMDYAHADGSVRYYNVESTAEGRLEFALDSRGHDISILTGFERKVPVLLPLPEGDYPVVKTGTPERLPMKLLNTNLASLENVTVTLTSEYPTVKISGSPVMLESVKAGGVVDLSELFMQEFISADRTFHHCRLVLTVEYEGQVDTTDVDVRIAPTPLEEPVEVLVLDGRTHTFRIFRQFSKGGGEIIERTVTEGEGNGNGVAEPGEEFTVWIRTVQGMDPYDKNTWHRTKVFCDDQLIVNSKDYAEQKGIEWTSVRDHTSEVRISEKCPPGHEFHLVLRNESYSYYWTPNTRFGPRLLRQPIQYHRTHVTGHTLKVGE